MARPMTSQKSAGYTGPRLASGIGTRWPSAAPPSASADVCSELEERVHALLERSTACTEEGGAVAAVQAAKDAARAEHKLCILREKAGQADLISLHLKFAVGLQLATAYHAAGQLDEALRAYEDIIQSQLFAQVGGQRHGFLPCRGGTFSCRHHLFMYACPAAQSSLDAYVIQT